MIVIDKLYRPADLPASCLAYRRDTMTLGWEDRMQAHGKRRSDNGVELGLALPRGTILRAGDCLVLDEQQTVVTVAERPEPVFVIEPRTSPQWATYAYHIGNRHQPVMITERTLVCPDVPGVEQMLRQHQIPYARAMQPFTPVTVTATHNH